MTKQSGRLGQLLIAKESARGTSTVTNGLWIPRSTISFDDKIESAREAEGVGKLADSDALFVTQKMAKGEFESNLDDKLAGIILTGLLGSSPVITGANPYTHTYTLSNTNQHQSVSVLYQDLDTAKMYSLGSIDSLKIAVEQNGIVQFTVGILSRVGKDWARQTATFNTLGNKFLHQHLQFRLADTIAGLTGATALSLKKLEINFTKNSIHDQVLGTVEPEDVLATNFSVEGSMELLKSDETYRNYMLNGTYKSMEVRFERSSVNSQLKMQFPRVDFTEWEQDRKLDDIVSQKINFKANIDNANALDIISTCTLLNTFAGTGY